MAHVSKRMKKNNSAGACGAKRRTSLRIHHLDDRFSHAARLLFPASFPLCIVFSFAVLFALHAFCRCHHIFRKHLRARICCLCAHIAFYRSLCAGSFAAPASALFGAAPRACRWRVLLHTPAYAARTGGRTLGIITSASWRSIKISRGA